MHNRVRQTVTVLGGHGRPWEVWLGSLQHYFCKLSYDMDWVYTIKNQTWTIAMGIEAIQIRTFVFRHPPSPSPFLLSMQIPRRPLDSPKHVVSYYLSFDHKCVRIPPRSPKTLIYIIFYDIDAYTNSILSMPYISGLVLVVSATAFSISLMFWPRRRTWQSTSPRLRDRPGWCVDKQEELMS